jgi:hypothetical protein
MRVVPNVVGDDNVQAKPGRAEMQGLRAVTTGLDTHERVA